MVCKNREIYGFLGPSWVLITMVPCNRVTLKTVTCLTKRCRVVIRCPGTTGNCAQHFGVVMLLST